MTKSFGHFAIRPSFDIAASTFVIHNCPLPTTLCPLLPMAKCEQGYLCDVCGGDVEELTDSDLYLRYVLGEVPPEKLHILRERHIRCNPVLAQFIVDLKFEPVRCEGAFAKEH